MAPAANFLTGADGGATTSRTLGLQFSQNPSVTNVIYVTYVTCGWTYGMTYVTFKYIYLYTFICLFAVSTTIY